MMMMNSYHDPYEIFSNNPKFKIPQEIYLRISPGVTNYLLQTL